MKRDGHEPSADTWDQVWGAMDLVPSTKYHSEIPIHLQRFVNLKGSKVLEIGGTGTDSGFLAQCGAHSCLIDFSSVATQSARALAREIPFDVVRGDANELPFEDGSFDAVFHQGLLEHFKEPEPLLREQHRVLRNGGILLADVPQRYSWYALKKRIALWRGTWPYGWETDFTYGGLVKLLSNTGFTPKFAYARGYEPRPYHVLRNLRKIESRLQRRVLPAGLWDRYDAAWTRFEQSAGGWHSLVNLGIIATKDT